MKFLLALAVLITFSANTESQTATKNLTCGLVNDVISELNNYGEVPIIMGKTNTGSIVISTFNNKTATWTVIEVKDQLACVLATGEGVMINKEVFQVPDTYLNKTGVLNDKWS